MRKKTLLAVAYLIAFPFVYLLPSVVEMAGVFDLPRLSLVMNGVAAFVVAGLLAAVLTPLNRRLLEWRKARGRDIEEEERFETEHGMIKLTPNDEG